MKIHHFSTACATLASLLRPLPAPAQDQPAASPPYQGWQHSGSIHLLTTPGGADLPATASVEGFPLLVRLHKNLFDFAQAMPKGEDLRFSNSSGPLAFQIEAWDPAEGKASIWVRIPTIKGNARQEIRLHWGHAGATSESNGAAVFNGSNGYLSVWHMNDPVQDEVGTLESKDTGTTATAGRIGTARHFAGSHGIFCGDRISQYPAGAGPHTSEAWFRPEQPNGRILAWGNEAPQGKVVMHLPSPPHVRMDCYFSGANVEGSSPVPMAQWVQVVHTYEKGDSRVYVNGVPDGVSKTPSAPLSIKSPARLWIGGWYDQYDFTGDIDEVRISRVARSADWVKLQYENQKPQQTLAGHLVQPGKAFSVSPEQLALREGTHATLTAAAGGAQKCYWILRRDGRESVIGTDQLSCTLEAGRVSGDQSLTLQFKAIYADGVKTKDIPITIQEDIEEPVFTLQAPATWDGRQPIEVVPQIANAEAMKAKGAGALTFSWMISHLAVSRETAAGKLILKRAQNSGKMVVRATVHNGGQPVTQSVTIDVTEPGQDAWVERPAAKDEKPENHQFYARDAANEGTLVYRGTLTEAADSLFLNVSADGTPFKREICQPGADLSYTLLVKLKPGLIKYRVEFGSVTRGREVILHTAEDLICGDAYVINGQSNAVATDWGEGDFPETSEWIRSYGSMGGNPKNAQWGNAVRRAPEDRLAIGFWGFNLARHLVEQHHLPVCIINGAVGGSRIDSHQRNPADPGDLTTIYGRLLWRVQQAGLTHGIRGVFWHQGENDQGADGPTGGFGWETYRACFIDLAAAWKENFPNIQHYYLFQIWPKSCAMGSNGSDNRLREVQRTLPTAFSNLSIMSTLGIDPPGGCHYPPEGYAEIARLISPLVSQYHYGKAPTTSITPPDLRRAAYTSGQRDGIVMEFDQPVLWDDALASEFQLDGENGKVVSGSVAGNVVTLKLAAPSTATSLTYLDSKAWDRKNLLLGTNGIAALTFCEVPLLPAPTTR